jgi:hypothetical protein
MRQTPYSHCVHIHALRGPLTKRLSHIDADVPLCDPGFLMSRLHPIDAPPSGRVLYIPHHSNRPGAAERLCSIGAEEYIDVMVLRSDLDTTMRKIAGAEFVLTNSLHVFIFCHSYNVPCAICVTGKETLNMPDKWRDVLESMGRTADERLPVVMNLAEGVEWWHSEGRYLTIPDTDALLRAFPLRAG